MFSHGTSLFLTYEISAHLYIMPLYGFLHTGDGRPLHDAPL